MPEANEGRSGGRRPLPAVLPPGLASTVDRLAARARKGQSLFDPRDNTLADDAAGIAALQLPNNKQLRTGIVGGTGDRPAAGLGARLRQIRSGRRLSQGQLARRAGISQAALSLIESGRRVDVQLDTVLALADALRLPLDALLGRTVPAAG